MAFTYQQILEDSYECHAAETAMANAELEAARLSEDLYRTREARDRLKQLNLDRLSLDQIANTYLAGQSRAQAANKYGLNAEEVEVAKISGITDEQYAANKQRMQQMKNEGYWSQGRVFK